MKPVFMTLFTAVICRTTDKLPADNPFARYLKPDKFLDCP